MSTKPQGRDTPEEIIFDANLQEFANQVGIICSLESGEKIAPHDAYKRIKKLWKDLRNSKRNLDIGADHRPDPKADSDDAA